MKHRNHRLRLVGVGVAALTIMLVAVACGGTTGTSPSPSGTTAGDVTGTINVMAVWSGAEQESFQAVLDGFTSAYPGVTVKYTSAGDQLPTVLSTAVQGGSPPDIAVVAQPGLMRDFVGRGVLQPLDFAKSTIAENFSQSWLDLATVDGTLYGLVFKGANKSTVWYNVPAFTDAGVQPPTTWDDLLTAAGTLSASGVKPYSIGGADGWTLTDLFENIYLRSAGAEMYDQLSTHQIPWTDSSVKEALTLMAQIFEDTGNIAGDPLQVDFPTSVTQVFADPPKAAMVFEGDFVQGVIADSTQAQAETGYNVFDFPSVNGSAPAVVGGGDMVVMFKDSPAAQALVEYLATPEAATIWAQRGGFSSPNMNVSADAYPDTLTAKTATALAQAETFRFDMSDLAPSAFGGTVGQGEWKILQDFLNNPTDIDGTAEALEAAAAQVQW